MMGFSIFSSTPLFWGASALVGSTLVWTGGIKTLAPHTFRRHLGTLGWVPAQFLSSAVTAAAATEVGWGVALLTGLLPLVALPLSAIALTSFSLISWWGVRSGKAEDCGCYGGYIQPSIIQSIAINVILLGLLVAAFLSRPAEVHAATWQLAAVALSASIAGLLSSYAQKFEIIHGVPRFTSSPLRTGAIWKHAWANGGTKGIEGEIIVALLGPDCPFCKQWVRIGNAMSQSTALPRVVGVVAAPAKRREEFIREHGIQFPVSSISQSLMSRLTQAVPTTILLDRGKITDLWSGQMPPEFVERFRRAFFPDQVVDQVKRAAPLGSELRTRS
jgi:hypothetical protein